MILKPWEELPDFLRTEEVRPYYDLLSRRRGSLALKRESDAPDLVAAPRVELTVLAPDSRVYAARADDYFHINPACRAAMAEQVELQLVTALEFHKEKCPVCGAGVRLP